MNRIVVLDTGPLSLVTNPRASAETFRCNQWMQGLLRVGFDVAIPEIADYELRRELLRADKKKGVARLDQLKATILYLPITTGAMLKAAEFWADARKQGIQTADDKALDGDVILAAQAALLQNQSSTVVVATTNVKHLSLFVSAELWDQIH
jgi:predicted nucleic acid-binding protein